MVKVFERVFNAISIRIVRGYHKASWRRNRLITQYLKSHPVAKLQIGCGPYLLGNWLNTDISLKACKKGAIYMDAGEQFPLPDESIDFIYSEHLVEHLTYRQIINMLHECRRVLKPHGIIRIATPDLRFLLDLYRNPSSERNVRYIRWSAEGGGGGGALPASPVFVINKFHTAWGHRIIYDYESLAMLLGSCGFSQISRYGIGESQHADLQDVERHYLSIPYDYYSLETFIVEASRDE